MAESYRATQPDATEEIQMNLPRIAVTMGDPAGIGPEVCLHLLANLDVASYCLPIVFGDADVLRRVAATCNLPLRAPVLSEQQWSHHFRDIAGPTILNIEAVDASRLVPGQISAATGEASFRQDQGGNFAPWK